MFDVLDRSHVSVIDFVAQPWDVEDDAVRYFVRNIDVVLGAVQQVIEFAQLVVGRAVHGGIVVKLCQHLVLSAESFDRDFSIVVGCKHDFRLLCGVWLNADAATDAAIAQPVLQALWSSLCEHSFNAITVDSDTSTSDTVLLAASGAAGNPLIADADDPALADFKAALGELMQDLSHQIVKDGEGASKFVEIQVTGAASTAAAKTVAMSIANSPLVKTAIAGEDANWGRIVMAIGKAGVPVDRDKLSIWIGPHLLAERGNLAGGYREEHGAAYMKQSELLIRTDLGQGGAEFTAWTCDLTHAYIDINADYRS